MSSRILQFQVGGNSTAVLGIEVDDLLEAGNRPASQGVVDKARQTLEAALSEVTPGVTAIVERLKELSSKPDEVGVEFGIKFTGEAGVLIAKTALEGNIKVSLKWSGSK